MIYPKFLQAGGTIGVFAPSCGITDEEKIKRFKNGKKNLEKRGVNTVFTDHVFTSDDRGASSNGKIRADEFMKLLKDDKVSVIVSAAGGDYLIEMLEYVDFEEVKKNPKWFKGYSDNTFLTYILPTLCDVASMYGANYSDYGMSGWGKSVNNDFDILKGNIKEQKSYDYFESKVHDKPNFEGYFNDEKVCWKNATGEDEIKISGRLIGGCMDVLNFIIGMPYDNTLNFLEKYKKDGNIWYLETFSLTAEDLYINLLRYKQMGFFKYTNGFVFGRPCFFESFTGLDFKRAILDALRDLGKPIIYDADIGHKGPQFTIINGAIGEFSSKNGKGSLKLKLEP